MQIQVETDLSVDDFIDLLIRSTLSERRPVNDRDRVRRMLEHANLIVTCRDASLRLIGVARAFSDFSYCTYLSDLAVDASYQRQGIGKRLIQRIAQESGPDAYLVLLAAPKAVDYYPHIGMTPHPSCWIRKNGEPPDPS